jgi:hypothetical protein
MDFLLVPAFRGRESVITGEIITAINSFFETFAVTPDTENRITSNGESFIKV